VTNKKYITRKKENLYHLEHSYVRDVHHAHGPIVYFLLIEEKISFAFLLVVWVQRLAFRKHLE
jgi:hypothetical protein